MATITLSDHVISTFTNGLATLSHVLRVAEAHAAANGLDADAEYLQARLVADQLPLTFQVQNATVTVRKNIARLTGAADVAWADDEKTFADLHARIAKALDVLKSADAAAIDARAEEEVELPFAGKPTKLSSKQSALGHGIPNFYFHTATAYSILRSKGVPIGKKDWIAGFLGVTL
ncbi:hypothetical protein B0T25DRAFT_477412 [Lasiosphaeria hispida]|uniref:Helix-turn-helix-domain containing protein type n=1 Tax=Lasiosphaeria hispida TaxID=260671 RepID=A0AAJ0HP59_9PEZI|nr:hypothetical protein B0T25DRAFT_477412 [Lasiosphaeria hispida]